MVSKSAKGGKKHRKTKKATKPGNLIAYGKIYADWCSHCITLEPEWKKVEHALLPMRSHNFESKNKDYLVDEFNRKYHTNLDKNVGFPTIFKYTKSGGIEIYKGARYAKDMIAWLKGKEKKEKTIFNWF
jgi:hypothetical protein